MIFSREIPPGSQLVERKLAERFKVSRVPVREALQRLMIEGLIENVPGKGLVTKIYDEQELLDLYHYREPLEGMAARLYCRHADEAEVELLRKLLEAMERSSSEGNLTAVHRNDFEFHLEIARGTRNARIFSELTDIYQECYYVTETRLHPLVKEMSEAELDTMYEKVLEEHDAVFGSLVKRDADAAEAAARYSVRSGLQRFMNLFVDGRVKLLGK